MKKVIYLCLVCVTLIALVSCASTENPTPPVATTTGTKTSGSYASTENPTPPVDRLSNWKNLAGTAAFIEGNYLYAAGYAQQQTLNNAKSVASLNAEVLLSSYIGNQIENAITNRADEVNKPQGDVLEGRSVEWLSSVASGKTSIKLSRVEVWNSENELTEDKKSYKVWTLLCMPLDVAEKTAQDVVKNEIEFISSEEAQSIKEEIMNSSIIM